VVFHLYCFGKYSVWFSVPVVCAHTATMGDVRTKGSVFAGDGVVMAALFVGAGIAQCGD
jgi:hypothetical protein